MAYFLLLMTEKNGKGAACIRVKMPKSQTRFKGGFIKACTLENDKPVLKNYIFTKPLNEHMEDIAELINQRTVYINEAKKNFGFDTIIYLETSIEHINAYRSLGKKMEKISESQEMQLGDIKTRAFEVKMIHVSSQNDDNLAIFFTCRAKCDPIIYLDILTPSDETLHIVYREQLRKIKISPFDFLAQNPEHLKPHILKAIESFI